MGQEQSGLVGDDVLPETLHARSLTAVADLIKDGCAKRIVVLTGAGLSTAAGIPDFRSPETGLYANLQRLNLPFAEAVFDINYFRQNPDPFYVLAKELYPGRFHPTISHVFISLLAQKGLLHMLFTQNIDCLERAAGVPEHLIVEAHGSFAKQRCIDCSLEFDDKLMRDHVARGDVPRCSTCKGLVKPDIVFFGEGLPKRFFDNRPLIERADLVLIIGTSLSVHPFASLPPMAGPGVPRVLFNLEQVGGIGCRADDVLALESCDSGIRALATELGWLDELEVLWRKTIGDAEADRQLATASKREEVVENEVANLADQVDKALQLNERDTDAEDGGQARKEAKPETAEKSDKGADSIPEIYRDRLEQLLLEAVRLDSHRSSVMGEADQVSRDTTRGRNETSLHDSYTHDDTSSSRSKEPSVNNDKELSIERDSEAPGSTRPGSEPSSAVESKMQKPLVEEDSTTSDPNTSSSGSLEKGSTQGSTSAAAEPSGVVVRKGNAADDEVKPAL